MLHIKNIPEFNTDFIINESQINYIRTQDYPLDFGDGIDYTLDVHFINDEQIHLSFEDKKQRDKILNFLKKGVA